MLTAPWKRNESVNVWAQLIVFLVSEHETFQTTSIGHDTLTAHAPAVHFLLQSSPCPDPQCEMKVATPAGCSGNCSVLRLKRWAWLHGGWVALGLLHYNQPWRKKTVCQLNVIYSKGHVVCIRGYYIYILYCFTLDHVRSKQATVFLFLYTKGFR